MQNEQEQHPPRLITALDRGRYIGTIHRGLLRDLLLNEGGIKSEEREGFIAIILAKDDSVLSSKLISIGNATTVMVSVRDTFREVVAHERWTKLIVAHNHPDGNPNPSQDDRTLTNNIKQGGKLLGVEVVDHIVVGDDSFYSFTEGIILPTYSNVISFNKQPTQSTTQQSHQNYQPVVTQQRQRPPKPQDSYGVTWHWSEVSWVWYQEPDTKTLFGKFLKKLGDSKG